MLVQIHEQTGTSHQLIDLLRHVEEGEDVILTRRGQAIAKIVPMPNRQVRESRRAVIERVMKSVAGKALPGPSAARSQDFLYDDDGLPA